MKTHQEICERCINSEGKSYYDIDCEYDPSAFEGCNTISELPENYLILKRCPCIRYVSDKLTTFALNSENNKQFPDIKVAFDIPQHCVYDVEHLMVLSKSGEAHE